jgi:hypothetical protein
MHLVAVLSCYNNDALDGVQRGLHFPHIGMVQADFMKMSFADNTFDAVYAIEATCHAPDPVNISKHLYCLYWTCQFRFLLQC